MKHLLTRRALVVAALLFAVAVAVALLLGRGAARLEAPAAGVAAAVDADIRRNLAERVPDLPTIDAVSATEVPGLYEVRLGTELIYTDAQANYVIQGQLIDARTRTNLTEARLNRLTAIAFDELPLQDAIVWKNGSGARKVAVFSDPNCGYCKKLEVDLQKLRDVTVYTFLIPVLGPDSAEKSKNIWCAKDQAGTWLGWMLDARQPVRAMGTCDTPLERNLALSRKHRVNGTPALVFTDNTRVPGAIGVDEIEQRLTAAAEAAAPAGKS